MSCAHNHPNPGMCAECDEDDHIAQIAAWKQTLDNKKKHQEIENEAHRVKDEIIRVLFLNLNWDARQQVKRMMSDDEINVLAKLFGATPEEINW